MSMMKAIHVYAADRSLFETQIASARAAIEGRGGRVANVRVSSRENDGVEAEYRAVLTYEAEPTAPLIRSFGPHCY